MKIFNKNKLLIIFFLIIQLFYKNITAQEISISNNSLENIAECISNCGNISADAKNIGDKTYSYNQGGCCCLFGRCPTRYNIYYTSRYGDASYDNYSYRNVGGWWASEQWDCMGSWTRCWKANASVYRPTCKWDNKYGYKKSYKIPYIREYASSLEDALKKAKEYCRKTQYTKECYKSCLSVAIFSVNNKQFKTIDEFIDALTKEQAVNGLIKKIGTKGMLEYYDPNKVY